MPGIALFLCGVALFTLLSFACAIVASQIMGEVQHTPFGARLTAEAEAAQKEPTNWFNYQRGGVFGFHPFNDELWTKLARAEKEISASSALAKRAKLLRFLNRARFVVLGPSVASFVYSAWR